MIYGNPEVTSGGQALKYYASVRWVHRTAHWQLILLSCTWGPLLRPLTLSRALAMNQSVAAATTPARAHRTARRSTAQTQPGLPLPSPLALQAGGAHQGEDFGWDTGPDWHPRQVSAHKRALCHAMPCHAVLCCAAAWHGAAWRAGMLCGARPASLCCSRLSPPCTACIGIAHTFAPFPPLAAGPL